MAGLLWNLLTKLGEADDAGPPRARRCDRFANAPIVDQFGERLRFRDIFVDGRALIVNTMFTVCRGACPGTSARLQSLRERLAPVFGDRLTIVSRSIDPERDDVRALRRFAALYGVGTRSAPGLPDWRFVTGSPAPGHRPRVEVHRLAADETAEPNPLGTDSAVVVGQGFGKWTFGKKLTPTPTFPFAPVGVKAVYVNAPRPPGPNQEVGDTEPDVDIRDDPKAPPTDTTPP